MKNGIMSVLGVLALVGSAFFYNGCSSSGSGASSALENRPETITYTGPGSYYSVVMNNDGTFDMEISEAYGEVVKVEINGTFEMLSNGFIRFTVVEATGEGAPDAEAKAYGIEAQGYGMFLMPLGGNELIPLLAAGQCPSANFSANWVISQADRDKDASDITDEFFGIFNYDHANMEGTVAVDGNLVDFADTGNGTNVLDVSNCSDGFFQLSESSELVANMWSTSEGMMVETFDGGERNSTIFALPADEAATAADLEGVWRGIVLIDQDDDNQDAESLFVEISLNASGEGTGRAFTDLDTFELEADGVNIALSANEDIGNGWFTGTLVSVQDGEASAESGNIACTPSRDVAGSGNDVMLCVGQNPGETTNHMNIILSKENSAS